MTQPSASTQSQIPASDTGHNNNKNDVTTRRGGGTTQGDGWTRGGRF